MNAEKQKFLTENFYGYETNETGESVWLFKESELVELMDKWKAVVCKEQRENDLDLFKQWLNDFGFKEVLEKLESVELNAPEPEI